MTTPTRNDVDAATKLLAKAKLQDPRMSVDEATILAWAEVLAPHRLALDDLLPAVVLHYSTSAERIMPATLLRIARERRRDELARSDDAQRALEAKADAKALPDELAERRALAVRAAAAKIGRRHDAERGDTFAAAPAPARAESLETIAAKVARARAAGPPAPMPADDTEATL